MVSPYSSFEKNTTYAWHLYMCQFRSMVKKSAQREQKVHFGKERRSSPNVPDSRVTLQRHRQLRHYNWCKWCFSCEKIVESYYSEFFSCFSVRQRWIQWVWLHSGTVGYSGGARTASHSQLLCSTWTTVSRHAVGAWWCLHQLRWRDPKVQLTKIASLWFTLQQKILYKDDI